MKRAACLAARLLLLPLAAVFALPAHAAPTKESSRASVRESSPPASIATTRADAVGLPASLAPAARLDTSALADAEAAEPPLFNLGDVVLVDAANADGEHFDLGPLTLVDRNLLRGPPPSYPETGVGGFELLPPFHVGASPSLSLWSRRACGSISCGLVSDSPEDPWGLVASVSKSGVIIGSRPDGSRYVIDPGDDPVTALRVLESDPEIHTAAQQEDLLERAGIEVPYSSVPRSGESLIGSRESNPRQFTHLPDGGSWIEAALVATTGLPPQTREQEILSNGVRAVASVVPAPAVIAARAKGGVGVAIAPAEFPRFQPSPKQEPPVIEPYDRRKHYGNTPTEADRRAVGGSPDHTPPLVRRYYEGDPTIGEKPGLLMTPEQRKASARDRDRMKASTRREQNKQGGDMSRYSKEKKRRLGLD